MANITDSLNVDDLGERLSNKSYSECLHAVSNFHTYSRRNILLIFKQTPHGSRKQQPKHIKVIFKFADEHKALMAFISENMPQHSEVKLVAM